MVDSETLERDKYFGKVTTAKYLARSQLLFHGVALVLPLECLRAVGYLDTRTNRQTFVSRRL